MLHQDFLNASGRWAEMRQGKEQELSIQFYLGCMYLRQIQMQWQDFHHAKYHEYGETWMTSTSYLEALPSNRISNFTNSRSTTIGPVKLKRNVSPVTEPNLTKY